MRISVIGGTGDLGSALAARLAGVGHEVWIGSRDPAKAEAFVKTVEHGGSGQLFGAGLADAAAKGEVCFVTVPFAAHAGTLEQIRAAVQGKIVVDATVPLRPPKVGTVQLPPGGSVVVEAQAMLGPEVRVVSALQNIGAEKLGSDAAPDADVLVAGDDAAAVEVVRGLLSELQLKSWHVGPLPNSAAAEALTSILIQLNRRYKLVQAGIRITGGRKEPAPALSVFAVRGLPLFAAGDDLAGALCEALETSGPKLMDGDVVVVAQKAVSKTEGRIARLADVAPSADARAAAEKSGKPAALAELIMSEASAVMRVADNLIIVRHHDGQVLANAGIDASNVGAPDPQDEKVLLWPKDPSASARALRERLQAHFGVRLAVVVSDSLGRAWRMGTTGSAIGVAGMKPLRDRRGERDLFGRELQATVIGVADEIAAAASLVLGEAAEGVPAAVVRGAVYDADESADLTELIRPIEQDLFQ